MNNSKCKHCLDGRLNEIGEKLYFCELWGEWRNYTLGDCIGNCEDEEAEEEYIFQDGGRNNGC